MSKTQCCSQLFNATKQKARSMITLVTRKRSQAKRVARPACANLTVHFLLTYRLSMLVQPNEWPLKTSAVRHNRYHSERAATIPWASRRNFISSAKSLQTFVRHVRRKKPRKSAHFTYVHPPTPCKSATRSLRGHWTKVNKIFIWRRGIIVDINKIFSITIFPSVVKYQHK